MSAYRASRGSGGYSSGSRYSPYGSSRGGGGGGACYSCGESGHISRECPSGGSSYGSRGRGRGRGGSRGGGRGGFGGGDRSEYGIKFGTAGAGLTPIDWASKTLNPFQRDFYKEHAKTAKQSDDDVAEWRKEHDIDVFQGYQDNLAVGKGKKGGLKPIMKFDHFAFPADIMAAVTKAGFTAPTPIQAQTWPLVLSGYNVIGIAKTGSGKTLAFLFPAIVHLRAQPPVGRGDGPIALIVAPTRELAQQIEGEVAKFAGYCRHACIYGGSPKGAQIRKLRDCPEIVCGTPGRILDFLECGITNFRRITYVVCDEADRMLDMGFEPQLNCILGQVRPDRQMLLYSATWPKEVRNLAREYVCADKGDDSLVYQVAVGGMEKLVACKTVKQIIKFPSSYDKQDELKKLIDEALAEDENTKMLVFISTKRMCNQMHQQLWSDGYWVTCMHGDKEQAQRESALRDFRSGQMKIMLATDVAARGIHVDDINIVVNFDFPNNCEDYVHRIGRTGRAGKKGTAITFFDKSKDAPRAQKLIKCLEDAEQPVPPELRAIRSFGGGGGRYGRRGGGYGGRRGGGGMYPPRGRGRGRW